MHTQRQMLELARQKQDVSYTQLAELLNVSRQALSQFKLGTPFSGTMAIKIAELANLDAAYVLACVEYWRAQRLERTETLPVWERVAAQFADKETAPRSAPLRHLRR